MTPPRRQQKGLPTGGQFAASTKAESAVSLTPASAQVRPANAGAVTRTLVAAGFRRGEEHKASRGMVRGGWSTFTEGITSAQGMETGRRRVRAGSYQDGTPRYTWRSDNTPTGRVFVEYQFRSHDPRNQAERNEKATEVLTRAAEVLRAKGFEVEMTTGGGTSAEPRLKVWRVDAEGEIVRW